MLARPKWRLHRRELCSGMTMSELTKLWSTFSADFLWPDFWRDVALLATFTWLVTLYGGRFCALLPTLPVV